MKLYLLYWDNGLDYSDFQETLLGIYSSIENRKEAEEKHNIIRNSKEAPFPLHSYEGHYTYQEIELDKSWMLEPNK